MDVSRAEDEGGRDKALRQEEGMCSGNGHVSCSHTSAPMIRDLAKEEAAGGGLTVT